jgi:hypothetical protein
MLSLAGGFLSLLLIPAMMVARRGQVIRAAPDSPVDAGSAPA